MESRYIHKSHNVSVLMYHVVCPAKYRRVVMSQGVDKLMKEVCLEIGLDGDNAHFLIQVFPGYSPSSVVQKVKNLTGREIFKRDPRVKKDLWGGEFWGKGYFINTVGQHGREKVIAAHVKGQGCESNYRALDKVQLDLGLS